MLTSREIETIRAALQFWREEICPHGAEVARPYLESEDISPLTSEEVERLRQKLMAARVRYARVSPDGATVLDWNLFATEPDVLSETMPGIVATVLLPET